MGRARRSGRNHSTGSGVSKRGSDLYRGSTKTMLSPTSAQHRQNMNASASMVSLQEMLGELGDLGEENSKFKKSAVRKITSLKKNLNKINRLARRVTRAIKEEEHNSWIPDSGFI